MSLFRRLFAARVVVGLVSAGCTVSGASAFATPFQLVYTGTFNSQEALNLASAPSPTNFTGFTPFTIRAFFDTSTPNLAPTFGGPFNGFRAYAPSVATIEIAGTVYGIETYLTNPTAGVTVAIFDQNSFIAGRYGIGLIADPVGDGAGVVGDFASASPNFSVSALAPTVFTDYYGVGHGSGVCASGMPPACPHVVTPWVLRAPGGAVWNLSFGNYEEDYPVAHTAGAAVGPLNTAQILAVTPAVPEPASLTLMLAALGGLAWKRRRTGD